jgi:hypothetical protein
LLRLDALAGEVHFAGLRHNPLTALHPGENLNLASRYPAESEVTQVGYSACVDHIRALQLAAVKYGSSGNQQRFFVPARELRVTE